MGPGSDSFGSPIKKRPVEQEVTSLQAGSECVYLYKGPWGFSISPEQFKAAVLGFTTTGRVRIKAYDHVNDKWFKVTVQRRSLRENVI